MTYLLEPLSTKTEMPILNNLSRSVRASELVAIMGPTGSGKTTLLNVLSKKIKHNISGQVLINSQAVKGNRLKRRMAYVLR